MSSGDRVSATARVGHVVCAASVRERHPAQRREVIGGLLALSAVSFGAGSRQARDPGASIFATSRRIVTGKDRSTPVQ